MTHHQPPPRPYSVKTLAARWGVSQSHIYHLIRKGKIATFRISEDTIRIPHHEVERIECGLSIIAENGAPILAEESESAFVLAIGERRSAA